MKTDATWIRRVGDMLALITEPQKLICPLACGNLPHGRHVALLGHNHSASYIHVAPSVKKGANINGDEPRLYYWRLGLDPALVKSADHAFD